MKRNEDSEPEATILPALPSGWQWLKVAQLASPEPNSITDGPFGSKLKTEHYRSSGPRVIRLQNVGDGNFRNADAYISDEHFATLQKHRLFPNDIVIAALGEVLPRACLVPRWLGPAIVKADCIRFKPNSHIIEPSFACWALNCEGIRRRTAKIIHGVGRPRLNVGEIKGIDIPVAPLKEQRRIVAKIDEMFSDLDVGVAALERAKANLKRYRASVLKAAIDGSLTAEWRAKHPDCEPAAKLLERTLAERRRKWEANQLAKFKTAKKPPPKNWQAKYIEPNTPDTGNLPVLPESWRWGTLEAIADIVGGIAKDKKRAGQAGMRETPYLRVANVQRGFLDLSEVKMIWAAKDDVSELRLRKGDVLFTEGGDRDKLGRGWVWNEELPECIHQNHIFRRRLVDGGIDPYFLSHHGNTFGREWFTRTGKQTTNLASINLGILRKFPVPIPPTDEQQQIVAELDERLSQISAAELALDHSLHRATRLRQSVLKQAFEGTLVPQDPGDEPASVLLERIEGDRPSKSKSLAGAQPNVVPRKRTLAKRKAAIDGR